jgi:hypothetical protein
MPSYKIGLALAGMALSTSVNATPVLVDFTSDAWSGAQGQTSFSVTYGSVDVAVVAATGKLTFNAADAPAAASPYDFLALHGDGIGIGDDEIGPGQSLGVSFSAGVKILGYYFLDLFTNEGPGGASERALVGLLTPGGTVSLTDSATAAPKSAGFYAREGLDIAGVIRVSLSSLLAFSDYSLAGILFDDGTTPVSVVAGSEPTVVVPEPAPLLLLPLGLLAFAFLRRREKAAG